MTLSETKSPGWMRAVQIVLGIIAVVGSIIALVFPAIATFTVVYILGIVLIFVGIERILIGIFSPAPGSSRWGTIGLGIIVLIVAGIVVAYPVGSTVFLLFVLAIALFCDGIARIVHSLAGRSMHGGSRVFGIIAGILISIALLIVGIQIIVAGVTGSRLSLPKPTKG